MTSKPHPEPTGQTAQTAPAAADVGPVVALAGDWHRQPAWAQVSVTTAAARGVRLILQLGDFGIDSGHYGQTYLQAVHETATAHDVIVLVTPGNHEDWPLIDAHPLTDRGNGFGPAAWFTDRIAVLPRGHRFTLASASGPRTFVSLGGAPSIDFEWRTKGADWHPAEMITNDDVAHTAAGGYADVLLAHDAPAPPYATAAVEQILSSNPQGWSDRALAYAKIGRDRITEAFLAVGPRLVAHGHYHAAGQKTVHLPDGRECEAVSLDMNNQIGSMAYLDLATLRLEWPDIAEWNVVIDELLRARRERSRGEH